MKQSILSLAGPSASTSFSLIYSVATWMSYLLYERQGTEHSSVSTELLWTTFAHSLGLKNKKQSVIDSDLEWESQVSVTKLFGS